MVDPGGVLPFPIRAALLYNDFEEELLMADSAKDSGETYAPYWKRLSSLVPNEVCERTEALYKHDEKGYVLPFLNQRYVVIPQERRILRMLHDGTLVNEELSPSFYLISLFYLAESKKLEPARRWISEKDIKGGEMFFRGPHAIQAGELIGKYGSDPEAFVRAGHRLGGVEMLYGDRSFGLDAFPRIPLVYVLWLGDREFSPQITIMFDQTIQDHFPLDVIWCTVTEVSRRLADIVP